MACFESVSNISALFLAAVEDKRAAAPFRKLKPPWTAKTIDDRGGISQVLIPTNKLFGQHDDLNIPGV